MNKTAIYKIENVGAACNGTLSRGKPLTIYHILPFYTFFGSKLLPFYI